MIITAVLDEDEYFHDQCYNDIRVVIVTKWRHFIFYLHMRSLDLQPISWYFFSQLQKFQYMKFMNQVNDQLPVVAMILLHLFLHPVVSIYEIDIIHFSWVYHKPI